MTWILIILGIPAIIAAGLCIYWHNGEPFNFER